MSKMDLVSCLLKPYDGNLSQAEKILLEIKLVTHFSNELFEVFKSRYLDYQKLIRPMEGKMCIQIMQEIVKDILSTDEYSLSGIANYTLIPEDVLTDIVSGINANPTFDISRKLFELHATVRRELYNQVMRKVAAGYLAA
jgi:hypothetical protein